MFLLLRVVQTLSTWSSCSLLPYFLPEPVFTRLFIDWPWIAFVDKFGLQHEHDAMIPWEVPGHQVSLVSLCWCSFSLEPKPFSLHLTNPFIFLFFLHALFDLIPLYFEDAPFVGTAVFDHKCIHGKALWSLSMACHTQFYLFYWRFTEFKTL